MATKAGTGGYMYKAISVISRVAAATTLLLAGYVFVTSLPDMRRYIRISTM
jgi:hypothetical protein